MNRVKLMLSVISDVRSLADNLQAVADAMMDLEPETETKQSVPIKEITKLTKKASKSEQTDSSQPKKEEENPLELEDVRAVLADKSRKGHTSEVKALLIKHGADKLSDIDQRNYALLLADAEAL